MTSIDKFSANVYSEESFSFTESEYDEVMTAMASDDFAGYGEWSAQVESENFYVDPSGKVQHKGQPRSLGRLEGIEL